ncbi:hypothetical protein BJ166DRAFT_116060 [Pestalotiopsis sp. NC0098]|nr:hypothetical protein BJ166DRAFT_116060 [Pestalotiopsis sp. NC0098]
MYGVCTPDNLSDCPCYIQVSSKPSHQKTSPAPAPPTPIAAHITLHTTKGQPQLQSVSDGPCAKPICRSSRIYIHTWPASQSVEEPTAAWPADLCSMAVVLLGGLLHHNWQAAPHRTSGVNARRLSAYDERAREPSSKKSSAWYGPSFFPLSILFLSNSFFVFVFFFSLPCYFSVPILFPHPTQVATVGHRFFT